MKSIKICSPQLGLSPISYLGGEVHDVQLINELCEKNVQCEVSLPKNRPYKKNSNLHVIFLPITHIVPPHIFNLLSLPYLFNTFKKEKFDILRIHSPYFLGFAAWIFKRIYPDVKIVTTIHLKEERPDLDFILKKTIHVYDHIFTVSDYLKRWLIDRYHIDPKKISVIYNGVDATLYSSKKDPALINKYHLKNKMVLLNLGLMIDRKNVLFLLNVFEKLHQKNQNLKLIFCGNGPLKQTLKSESISKGLSDSVLILDPVFAEEKNKLFNLADVFMFPSKNEGFGLVAAEAMACGKPVIASNNTSLPEIVDDQITGYLAETNDLDDWIEKTEKLIKDNRKREEMGKRSIKKSKKLFKWAKVTEKTLDIYQELCK
jgi:glycosyltransferase involved in cell wall biosynthesis